MNEAFSKRMAELDALVDQCRGQGPFADGIVRDTSNRSNRDWPWWSVEIQRTEEDGTEKRRAFATIRLNSNAAHMPGSYEAEWSARIWEGVSTDSFSKAGGWPLDWELPSPEILKETLAALLREAEAAIAQAVAVGRRA